MGACFPSAPLDPQVIAFYVSSPLSLRQKETMRSLRIVFFKN